MAHGQHVHARLEAKLARGSATAAPLLALNSMPSVPPRSVRKSAPLVCTSFTSSGSAGAAPMRAYLASDSALE